MTEREKYQAFEHAFASLVPEERAAILKRADERVRAAGKDEKHWGYSTLVRLQRDRLVAQERPGSLPAELQRSAVRPGSLPIELRRSAVPSRERHEPMAVEREDET